MVKVTFTSHNKEIYCNKGDKLLDVARNADIFIDAPCNGNVSCGKCKVRLIKGKVDTEKTHHIKDEEWNQGYILACNTKVIEDIDIEVPSKLSSSMYGMKIEGSDNRKDKEVFDRAKKIIKENNFKFETNIEKTYIELDEPTLDDNISDIDRIERHIRNSLGYNEIDFTIDLLRKVPTVIRKDNFKVTITYIKKKNKITILNIESGNTENKLYGVAIDIGTTSVVVCLVDLYTKEILDKASSLMKSDDISIEELMKSIYDNKIEIEKEKENIQKNANQIELLRKSLEKENTDVKRHEQELIENAKREARALILSAKDEVNDILHQMNELQNNINSDSIKNANQLRNKLNDKLQDVNSSNDNGLNLEILKTLNSRDMMKKNTLNKKISPNSSVSFSKNGNYKGQNISSEINVIGLNVDEATFLIDKYLDDLTTGINNLYIMSDGDVIVGGPVAVYLEKYKDIISKMLIDKCSFDIDGSYLSFAKCTQQQADSGAALTFFSDFISQI